MSKRKPKAKGKPPAKTKPSPADAVGVVEGTPVEDTLEQNTPHDVAIQDVNDVQEASNGDDAPSLPTLDLPPVAEHAGVDLEATVDLRGPLDADTPQRDDAAPEEPEELEAVDVGEAAELSLDVGEAAELSLDVGEAAELSLDVGEAAELSLDELEAGDAAPEEPSAAPEADEDEGADSITTSATDRERTNLKGLVEALVFATDKPIKVGELARLTDAAPKLIRVLLAELAEEYKPRGIQLSEVAGGYLFRTNVRYGSFVRELTQQKPVRLSRAQLEALAILAYRQPITRPEIDEIRGVDSGPVLKMLLERELVRILGKRDEVGRPLIYGTTPEFLEFFGLKSLKDLPNLREFTELTDESHAIAEKELGESWRGPEGADGDEGADAVAAEPAERGEVESESEGEGEGESDAERDAEEEKIALESVVEHVSVDDPESGFESVAVEEEADEPLAPNDGGPALAENEPADEEQPVDDEAQADDREPAGAPEAAREEDESAAPDADDRG